MDAPYNIETTEPSMNTISGILFFCAFFPYVWGVLSGETVPSPVSWAIWASVDTLALLAMRKEKAPTGQLTGAVAGAWTVFAVALVFGKPTIGSIELVSIIGALAGILLWKITDNALTAIVCSQLATFFGSIPTAAGAWDNPLQESLVAWSMWTLSGVCALFAIEKWNLASALQPLNFTAIDGAVVVLIVLRPLFL